MELIQQQIVQVKKNERTNALKQVKRICKEYDFSAAMLEAGKGVKWIVRVFALRMASFLPLNLFKNVLGLIVLAKYFPEIKKSPYFHRREDLWSFVMNEENSEKVLFLEFGVHKGYSIKKIYCKLKNDQFEEKLINDEIQRLNDIDNIELNLLENFCKKKKIQNLREILDNDDKKSFYKILNKLIAEGFRKDACLKFFKIF